MLYIVFRETPPGNADSMLRVDDCVVLRRVSMGGGEENPEPPTETGSRRTSNGLYREQIIYRLNKTDIE